MRTSTARSRTAAALAAGALILVGVTACSPAAPTPDGAADALATGLATGDLTEVELAGATPTEATAQLTAALAGLDPLHPTVEVGKVTLAKDGATATAALGFTWDLDESDTDWTYSTTATLDLVENVWQAKWSSYLIAPDLLPGETLSLRRDASTSERASVLGAGGAVLVEARAVVRLGLDKTRVDPAGHDASARLIAAILGLDPQAYAERVAAAGEKAFVEGLVVRTDGPGVDLAAFEAVDGALGVPDSLPLAHSRLFARAILGTAGPATAEIVDESAGRVQAGDIVGLSGLQRQYDAQLAGLPGQTVVVTSADGATTRDVFVVPATPGEPLVTTLDPTVQDAAEAVLADVGPASAIVAIRPSTGEVLAAANGVGSEGLSTATVGTYPPGSVFKVVSSLALLRAGLTPDSEVSCPVSIDVDGRTFENFPGYPAAANGPISLQTAVANSCNTAFIGARDLVGQAGLAEAGASLGLGLDADIGYPESLGTVPTDSTGTDHAASMIGQGRLQVSPLGMATVAASVANGTTVVPWLVGPTAPEAPAPAVALTADEAASLRTMMRAVVTDGGADFLLDVPGAEVLAKTGTAQYGEAGALRNHVWMIAIQGDLAVAVFVADGDYGSTTAGPLLKTFLTQLAP
ncbi:penicillin-binding transpeptidase domain-containing protein [Pengzhenrongella frigida]|uniref:Penicillin-binding protein n=1 Tax=Pengzhenrongella frigida TaxID=1259133 RepID=A0A4Q5N0X9_9MICO|nr:penicillin-binding transpeptidase domain-containing protein [Cellulomonas sp. HLT2-17]RYV51686.1 penicillin-binding protein [Cellulomonas sp. HLT2-17]